MHIDFESSSHAVLSHRRISADHVNAAKSISKNSKQFPDRRLIVNYYAFNI